MIHLVAKRIQLLQFARIGCARGFQSVPDEVFARVLGGDGELVDALLERFGEFQDYRDCHVPAFKNGPGQVVNSHGPRSQTIVR